MNIQWCSFLNKGADMKDVPLVSSGAHDPFPLVSGMAHQPFPLVSGGAHGPFPLVSV